MNRIRPLISVVMPVYNAEAYLKLAIESILNQTFENLELIIIDDASTDNSIAIIDNFSDSRIRVIKNAENKGIVYSRNRGLAVINGEYYAPFDADDIARKDKLEKQLAFLQKHPDYGMIGSWAKLIDENNIEFPRKWKLDAPAKRIPAMLLFRNYFVQSAMLIRREAIPRNGYQEGLDTVEDYKMWIDIIRNHKGWNYPEYLVKYRIHDKSITQQDADLMPERDASLFKPLYEELGIILDHKKLILLRIIKNQDKITSPLLLKEIERFLLEILNQNRKTQQYDQLQLYYVVLNRWIKVCSKAFSLRQQALWRFLKSSLLWEYPFRGRH